MVHVYVLRSLADGARYTGMSKNPQRRLKEHNAGKNRYTKAHIPWVMIYCEEHQHWREARVREKYLKSAAGRKWIDQHVKNKGSLPA